MGFTTHQRHKKILKLAKGFRGRRKNCYTLAIRSVIKAQARAYVGRKLKKRDMKTLWIQRINASARLFGTTYKHFIHDEKLAGIVVNRKMLSELAVTEPCSFNSVLCAMKVLKEMGLVEGDIPTELPDHSAVDDINVVIAEMKRMSI